MGEDRFKELIPEVIYSLIRKLNLSLRIDIKYSLLFIGIAFLIAGCGGEGPDTAGTPYVPTLPVDTLEIVLEMGVELGDSTNTFAAITSCIVDDTERILVLDQVSADLRLFDAEGQYIQQLARRGNGPGELQMPWDMFIMPDGRLMVLD